MKNLICHDCGVKYGRCHVGHLATYHEDVCDYRGEIKAVTEPRDYGYLELPKENIED